MSARDSLEQVHIESSSAQGELQVGLARADITPEVGQPLGGFMARSKVNNGAAERIHDPLFARVLVLKVGDISVAIVSLDLPLFSSERVVREARRQFNLTQVILHCTHTHAGPFPSTGGMTTWEFTSGNPAEKLDFQAFENDPWYARTQQKVIDAIGQAVSSLFPATLSIASQPIDQYLAHNRRQLQPDGRVKMLWDNPQRVPTSPLDPTVRVLRVDDLQGRTRAVLTQYACHPVVLGAKNLDVSADFPGVLCQMVEAACGPDCLSFFLQGASGDIDPCDMGLAGEHGHQTVRSTGQALAEHVLAMLRKATLVNSSSMSLGVTRLTHTLPMYEEPQRKLEISSVLLTLGDQLAMLMIPGEVFVQHQLNFTDAAPQKHAMILGLSYNGRGVPLGMYLPTEQASREGGYGANSCVVFEPAAGRKIVGTAVTLLRQQESPSTQA